jgi:hypothetical protein
MPNLKNVIDGSCKHTREAMAIEKVCMSTTIDTQKVKIRSISIKDCIIEECQIEEKLNDSLLC